MRTNEACASDPQNDDLINLGLDDEDQDEDQDEEDEEEDEEQSDDELENLDVVQDDLPEFEVNGLNSPVKHLLIFHCIHFTESQRLSCIVKYCNILHCLP